jgi:hypothetical protein
MIHEGNELNVVQAMERLRDDPSSAEFDLIEILAYLIRGQRQMRNTLIAHEVRLRRLQTTTDFAEVYLYLTPSGVESVQ